ncbi:MarR family transcriptional regulator, partial [Streptomyces sp. NPDC051665]|uniref:MarR family transcriptional regulator n=1 Tax=Streptomyces sp. NPDC051665 TaxID=3154647 RepID=UPI00342B7CFD
MGANLLAVRSHNAALVLDLLRTAGTDGISRLELADRTGLTPQAVSKITARLRDSGLVAEAGRRASTGGKPRTVLRLVPEAGHAVGVHLDRDELRVVLVDLTGAVVGERSAPLDLGAGAGVVVEAVAREVEGLVGGGDLGGGAGVGVSAGVGVGAGAGVSASVGAGAGSGAAGTEVVGAAGAGVERRLVDSGRLADAGRLAGLVPPANPSSGRPVDSGRHADAVRPADPASPADSARPAGLVPPANPSSGRPVDSGRHADAVRPADPASPADSARPAGLVPPANPS